MPSAPAVSAAPSVPAAPSGAVPPPLVFPAPSAAPVAPAGAYAVADTTRPPGFLGLLALILALVAAVVTPIIVGINAFAIGRILPPGISANSGDLSIFSPARDLVLWAELSFWTGAILGIAAIVIGIIAIRRKQGRGAGIAALVVAVLAAVIFFLVLVVALGAGSAAGLAGFTA